MHIVQRGHNREPCFFGDEDYFTYLHWLLCPHGGEPMRIIAFVTDAAVNRNCKRTFFR